MDGDDGHHDKDPLFPIDEMAYECIVPCRSSGVYVGTPVAFKLELSVDYIITNITLDDAHPTSSPLYQPTMVDALAIDGFYFILTRMSSLSTSITYRHKGRNK